MDAAKLAVEGQSLLQRVKKAFQELPEPFGDVTGVAFFTTPKLNKPPNKGIDSNKETPSSSLLTDVQSFCR